ncbi:MAG: hypothetical protein IJ881_06740, partial [Neisseriaceae bacterium]|nr:hypothetical protein [Neisseriaceae bacterium]
MKTQKTPRRRSREFAVQGVYRLLLNPDASISSVIAEIKETEPFVKALTAKKKPQVDEAFFEQ